MIPPPSTDPPAAVTPNCPNNVKVVQMDAYAIEYTLPPQTGSPNKENFKELQKVTETFLKNHMINSYKMSTQANLCDFTAPLVVAHFTYVYLSQF